MQVWSISPSVAAKIADWASDSCNMIDDGL